MRLNFNIHSLYQTIQSNTLDKVQLTPLKHTVQSTNQPEELTLWLKQLLVKMQIRLVCPLPEAGWSHIKLACTVNNKHSSEETLSSLSVECPPFTLSRWIVDSVILLPPCRESIFHLHELPLSKPLLLIFLSLFLSLPLFSLSFSLSSLSLSLLSLSQWGKSSVLISEITGKAPAESELRAAGSASLLHFWYYSSQQPSELWHCRSAQVSQCNSSFFLCVCCCWDAIFFLPSQGNVLSEDPSEQPFCDSKFEMMKASASENAFLCHTRICTYNVVMRVWEQLSQTWCHGFWLETLFHLLENTKTDYD